MIQPGSVWMELEDVGGMFWDRIYLGIYHQIFNMSYSVEFGDFD